MISFGILYFFLTIFMVSNLVFNVGAFMAERFLFLPSAGLCLAAGGGLSLLAGSLSPARKHLVPLIVATMALFFMYRTIERNKVWKDDFTLYTHDVKVSANSAKGNNIAAKFYAYEAGQSEDTTRRSEYYDEALRLFRRAVQIHPDFIDAWFHLGNTWYAARRELDSTLACYAEVFRLDPEEPNTWTNLRQLATAGSMDQRVKVREFILRYQPDDVQSLDALGSMLVSQERSTEALPLFRRMAAIDSTNVRAFDFLGVIYFQQNKLDSAGLMFRRAMALDPTNRRHRDNLYSTLLRQGRTVEARRLIQPGE